MRHDGAHSDNSAGSYPQRIAMASLPNDRSRADVRMITDMDVTVAANPRCERDEIANDTIMLDIGIEVRLKMGAYTDIAGQRYERRNERSFAKFDRVHHHRTDGDNVEELRTRHPAFLGKAGAYLGVRDRNCNLTFRTRGGTELFERKYVVPVYSGSGSVVIDKDELMVRLTDCQLLPSKW